MRKGLAKNTTQNSSESQGEGKSSCSVLILVERPVFSDLLFSAINDYFDFYLITINILSL